MTFLYWLIVGVEILLTHIIFSYLWTGSDPQGPIFVKFTLSEKATKNEKIFTVNLTACSNLQINGGLLRKHEL